MTWLSTLLLVLVLIAVSTADDTSTSIASHASRIIRFIAISCLLCVMFIPACIWAITSEIGLHEMFMRFADNAKKLWNWSKRFIPNIFIGQGTPTGREELHNKLIAAHFENAVLSITGRKRNGDEPSNQTPTVSSSSKSKTQTEGSPESSGRMPSTNKKPYSMPKRPKTYGRKRPRTVSNSSNSQSGNNSSEETICHEEVENIFHHLVNRYKNATDLDILVKRKTDGTQSCDESGASSETKTRPSNKYSEISVHIPSEDMGESFGHPGLLLIYKKENKGPEKNEDNGGKGCSSASPMSARESSQPPEIGLVEAQEENFDYS